MCTKARWQLVILVVGAGTVVLGLLACTSGESMCFPSLDHLPGILRVGPQGWDVPPYLVWSPDGNKLAGSWGRAPADGEATGEIYILDLTTGELHLLLKTRGVERLVQDWSPDGKEIVFVVEGCYNSVERYPEGIWVVNIEDSRQMHFLGPGELAAWSPDGKEMAIYEQINDPPGKGKNLIWILDLATGSKRLVFHRPTLEGSVQGKISWSPDGTRLAFGWKRDIYVLDLQSGAFNRLTTSGGDDSHPIWSPNGEMIAYIHSLGVCEDTVIITRVDGSCSVQPLKVSGLFSDITWSRDGRKLAFSWLDGIYILDIPTVLGEDFLTTGLICP